MYQRREGEFKVHWNDMFSLTILCLWKWRNFRIFQATEMCAGKFEYLKLRYNETFLAFQKLEVVEGPRKRTEVLVA